METLEQKIARVVKEQIEILTYDPAWPQQFQQEKCHLRTCLPKDLVGRIEHFGSTAVPGLAAKPIVDMLVEVKSLDRTKKEVAPVLERQGYDYFWRPSFGDNTPPFYAWFIKRDKAGIRTHHIHMIEPEFQHWERLLFRDYLIEHSDTARQYTRLKKRLSTEFQNDRVAYTQGKTQFISQVMDLILSG